MSKGMELVEAFGSWRIMEGGIEIERHGDKGVAEKRMKVMQSRRQESIERKRRFQMDEGTVAGEPDGMSEDQREFAGIRNWLERPVKEILPALKESLGMTVRDLTMLRAVEESEAGRQTVLDAIDARIKALSEA